MADGFQNAPQNTNQNIHGHCIADRQAELPVRDTCSLRGADEALRQALQAEQLLGGQHATLPRAALLIQ